MSVFLPAMPSALICKTAILMKEQFADRNSTRSPHCAPAFSFIRRSELALIGTLCTTVLLALPHISDMLGLDAASNTAICFKWRNKQRWKAKRNPSDDSQPTQGTLPREALGARPCAELFSRSLIISYRSRVGKGNNHTSPTSN